MSAPHPLRPGVTSEACTFLQGSPSEQHIWHAGWKRANGGVVPRVVYAVVWLDICAVGLVIPLLSFYARDLGGGPAFAGALSSAYGMMNLVGAGFMGSFSDTHGRRLVLIISLMGAISGYFMLFLSVFHFKSLAILFLSRVPIGLAKQTMTASRAIVSDCSSDSDRALVLSRVSVAAGLGFVVGPMCGGILSATLSPYAPPIISVFFFIVALVLVVASLKETAPLMTQKNSLSENNNNQEIQNRTPILLAWTNAFTDLNVYTNAFRLLILRMLVQLPYLMMTQSFSEYTLRKYSLSPKQNGYALAYCGLISVGANLCLGPYIKFRLTKCKKKNGYESKLVACSAFVVGISLFCLSLVKSLKTFYISLIPLAISSAIFRTAVISVVTLSVPRDIIGKINGAVDASDSLARIIAPLISGLLMEYMSIVAPFQIGSILCFMGSLLMYYFSFQMHKNDMLKKNE